MSNVGSAKLAAWLRFVPAKDGYGLPLFSAAQNYLLLPETDNKLLITSFVPFYNEQRYTIAYDLPATATTPIYNVGDIVPIPISASGKIEVIHGNLPAEDFEQRFSSRLQASAFTGIQRLLTTANEPGWEGLIPFVNRNYELRELMRLWDDVAYSKQSRWVFISGMRGLGKTALVQHFVRLIGRESGVRPIVVGVNRRGGMSESLMDMLGPYLNRFGSGREWSNEDAREFFIDSAVRKSKYIRGELEGITRKQPLIISIDDTDITGDVENLGDEIIRLMDDSLGLPVLWLVISQWRPSAHQITDPTRIHYLDLQQLSRTDMRQWFESLGTAKWSSEQRDALARIVTALDGVSTAEMSRVIRTTIEHLAPGGRR
jgi:hypothetical protein